MEAAAVNAVLLVCIDLMVFASLHAKNGWYTSWLEEIETPVEAF